MTAEGEGNEGTSSFLFSPPLPLQPFFCFRSNFRAITRLETLATQAIAWVASVPARVRGGRKSTLASITVSLKQTLQM